MSCGIPLSKSFYPLEFGSEHRLGHLFLIIIENIIEYISFLVLQVDLSSAGSTISLEWEELFA
jgi:hypothetical protein